MKLIRSAMFWPVLLLLLAMISSLAIYTVRSGDYSEWCTAPGVVLELRNTRRLKVLVVYSYTVEDQQYVGRDSFSRSSYHTPVGSEITVWYDPDTPSRVSYGKPNAEFDAAAPFFLVIPLSFGVLLLNVRREQTGQL